MPCQINFGHHSNVPVAIKIKRIWNVNLYIFTGCGALKSKWKCKPSRSCDWYKEFVKNLGKYSTGDQKFKELKDFYDERKCAEGHVYCSSDGKFPRDSGDLPKLKRCWEFI